MIENWKDTKFYAAVGWHDLKHYPRWWLLLSGDRLLIAGTTLLVVFVGFWGGVRSGLFPLDSQTATLYLLFALTSGNITLISIVVSLSQLIVTRHLESPSDINEEMNNMRTYRQQVSDTIDQSVTPVRPAAFFLVLFRSLQQDLNTFENQELPFEDDAARRDFEATFAELNDHITSIIELLEESEAGLIFALFTTLSMDYERYTQMIWWLQYDHEEQLPAATDDTIERIRETIEHIGVARRIFKNTYIQSELTSLSRRLLYIGLPVLVATMGFMLTFTASAQASLGPTVLSVAIPLLVTAGLAPIVVLATSVLRLAALTGQDTAMYSFVSSFEG